MAHCKNKNSSRNSYKLPLFLKQRARHFILVSANNLKLIQRTIAKSLYHFDQIHRNVAALENSRIGRTTKRDVYVFGQIQRE